MVIMKQVGDIHKSDDDDPSENMYIYTTTFRHIIKVELHSKKKV